MYMMSWLVESSIFDDIKLHPQKVDLKKITYIEELYLSNQH